MSKASPKTPKSKRRTVNKPPIKIDNVENNFGFTVSDQKHVYAYKRINKCDNILEVEIMSKYNHPNILKMKEMHVEGNQLFLMIELQNQTLKNYCQSFNTTLNDKLIIIYKICRGLKVLHDDKILHGSINYSSFSINSEGELIFTSFDSCRKMLEEEIYTEHKNELEYLSPKILSQISNSEKIKQNLKDDVWSLGLLIFNILENRYDTKFESITEIIESNQNKFRKELSKHFFKKIFNYSNDMYKNIVDLLVNILTYDENERYSVEQILNHALFNEIRKYDQYQLKPSYKFTPGNHKFNDEFRGQLKTIIAFLNANFPEFEIEIFFFIIDIYYKCYSLKKYENLTLYGFCSILLGILYFNPLFDLNQLKKDVYESVDVDQVQHMCFDMIKQLNGVIYTNEPYKSCVHQEDMSLILDDLIMDKSFGYFNFNPNEWNTIFENNRDYEVPILKQGLKIKDMIDL